MYFVFSSDIHLWNNLPILINITFFTTSSAPAGNLIFFLYIAPNLILYGRRHLPPICDDDWDIVSNLKSRSTFECFPCFRGFRWELIQIKFCHVDNARRHLIATSLPPFSFVIGDILRFCHGWTGLFRLGDRGHILLNIASMMLPEALHYQGRLKGRVAHVLFAWMELHQCTFHHPEN
jgi:hypothetical protein